MLSIDTFINFYYFYLSLYRGQCASRPPASVKLTCASKDALTFNWFKKTSTGDVRVSVAGASNSYQETGKDVYCDVLQL